jgi:hypothetical protein
MQLDLRGKEFFAWRAIEMGRPLLAMRVSDLLATVRAQKAKKIYVIGLEGAARC